MVKEELKTCEERYPIGTKVIITKDCRKWERATLKKGIIVKYLYYIIPRDYFPLNIKNKKNNIKIMIDDLEEEDLKLTMPIIKYGHFSKIKGDQCWWSSLEEFEKIKKLQNELKSQYEI